MSLSDLLKANIPHPSSASRKEHARVLVRVSHERSAEKAISPETQRRAIEAYAAAQGYEIVHWYTELAKSAFRDEDQRIEFHRMIADAKADPHTSVILVYRYDRFSRSWAAPGQQDDLLRHGVRIESVAEGYYDPDSEVGAIMMPLTWSLNRLFSLKLRNVVIPNMKTNFEQRDPETGWAYKNGGWAQFGYKAQRIHIGRNHRGDIHKMIWVEDDSEVAGKPIHEWARAMLIEWRLRDRLGYSAIAGKLTSLGIRTPMGRSTWSPASVQSLCAEWPRLYQYTGIAFWNREDCTDRADRKQRDPSEWVVVENAHPALITEAEADAIYAMVSDRKTGPSDERRKHDSRWALTGGLIKCAHCGANYAGHVSNGRDYYLCGSHIYRRGADCPAPSWRIPREKLEELVLGKVARTLERSDEALDAWIGEINEALEADWSVFRKTAPERKRRIAEEGKRLKNLMDTIALTGPGTELVAAIRETQAELDRLRAVGAISKPHLVDAEPIRELRDRVRRAATDEEDRRTILRAFTIEILVDAEKRSLEGVLHDPRSFYAICLAAPRGVLADRVTHAQVRWSSSWCRGRRFRAA